MSIFPKKFPGIIELMKQKAKKNPDILRGLDCIHFSDTELRNKCIEVNTSNDSPSSGMMDESGSIESSTNSGSKSSNSSVWITISFCIFVVVGFIYYRVRKNK